MRCRAGAVVAVCVCESKSAACVGVLSCTERARCSGQGALHYKGRGVFQKLGEHTPPCGQHFTFAYAREGLSKECVGFLFSDVFMWTTPTLRYKGV